MVAVADSFGHYGCALAEPDNLLTKAAQQLFVAGRDAEVNLPALLLGCLT